MEAYGVTDKVCAGKRGHRLKKDKEVAGYIERQLEEIRKRANINADRLINLLTDIAYTSPAFFATIETEGEKQKLVWKDTESMPDDVKRAIAVMKNTPGGIVIETLDRMKAIDLLLKYLGMDKKNGGGVVIKGEEMLEE